MALCRAFCPRPSLLSLLPVLLLISAQFVSGMDFFEEWELPSDRLDAFQKRRARELFGKRSSPPAAGTGVNNYERHSRRTRELFGKRASAAEPFTEMDEVIRVPLLAVALPDEGEQYSQRAPVMIPSGADEMEQQQREEEKATPPLDATGALWLLQRHRRGVHRELFG